VLINCFAPGGTQHSILPNEAGGGRAAAELALTAGHRKLAFLTGMAGSWATRERLKGFRAALRAAGVATGEQAVLEGNYRADSGYELTRRLLATTPRPTAILCGNDLMALGAYLALGEAGLRIPEDISVVGYDDRADLAADLHPALSTIRLPYYEMGRHAAEAVFAGSGAQLPARTYIPCPAVPRASLAPPARSR
jgi:LacI family transcriptional regulator